MLSDEDFFKANQDRWAHIREPEKPKPVKNKARQVVMLCECELQFRQLGKHDRDRRRILVYRVQPENPLYDPMHQRLIPIPFLLEPGEVIPDSDEILLPILHQLMTEANG